MRNHALLSFVLTVLASVTAEGAEYSVAGLVKDIGSNDRDTYGANSNGFSLSGVTSAGTCATNDGLVWFVLKDNYGGSQQLAILLSAKLSGMPVTVRVNDTIKNSFGACYLQVLNMDMNTP
jgi:hypothetical protein